MDQEDNRPAIVAAYRKQKPFPRDKKDACVHLSRPKNPDLCIFCQELRGPHEKQFNMIQQRRDTGLVDHLFLCQDEECDDERCRNGSCHVDCERVPCQYKFHLSCMTYSRPIYKWSALYISQECNQGKLMCPDHFCEMCFTHSKQQTAAMKNGNWMKSENQIRVWHQECRPIIAADKEKENVSFRPIDQPYKGSRLLICLGCAQMHEDSVRSKPGFDAKTTPNNLKPCKTCIRMFHVSCHENFVEHSETGPTEQCEDCLNQTPIRKSDKVVIEKNGTGIFCAATVLRVEARKANGGCVIMIGYRFLSDEEGRVRLRWTPSNRLVKFYPILAPRFFAAIRDIYNNHHCAEPLCSELAEELVYLADHCMAQFNSDVHIQRPEPVLSMVYGFDEDFLQEFPEMSQMRAVHPDHPHINMEYSEGRGFRIVTTKDIERHTILGEYIGKYITGETSTRLTKIGAESADRERKRYEMRVNLKTAGNKEEIVCAIDASTHHNMMCFVNHSCDPNCIVVPVYHKLGNGLEVQRIVVRARKNISAGAELSYNYNWKGFLCACPEVCADKKQEWTYSTLICQLDAAARTPVVAAGTPVVAAGTPVVAAGTPVVAAGTPVVDAGTPVVAAGTSNVV